MCLETLVFVDFPFSLSGHFASDGCCVPVGLNMRRGSHVRVMYAAVVNAVSSFASSDSRWPLEARTPAGGRSAVCPLGVPNTRRGQPGRLSLEVFPGAGYIRAGTIPKAVTNSQSVSAGKGLK